MISYPIKAHKKSFKSKSEDIEHQHFLRIKQTKFSLHWDLRPGDNVSNWLPITKNRNRQQQDCCNCLAVEGEDEGVKPLVEGRLEDDEHAGVDELYDNCYYVRLLGVHLIDALLGINRG